jgi:hypothetical protein
VEINGENWCFVECPDIRNEGKTDILSIKLILIMNVDMKGSWEFKCDKNVSRSTHFRNILGSQAFMKKI